MERCERNKAFEDSIVFVHIAFAYFKLNDVRRRFSVSLLLKPSLSYGSSLFTIYPYMNLCENKVAYNVRAIVCDTELNTSFSLKFKTQQLPMFVRPLKCLTKFQRSPDSRLRDVMNCVSSSIRFIF